MGVIRVTGVKKRCYGRGSRGGKGQRQHAEKGQQGQGQIMRVTREIWKEDVCQEQLRLPGIPVGAAEKGQQISLAQH